MIAVRGVSKSYQEGEQVTQVLRDIHFTVQSQEMVAIMGASGSGKSTLLHILGCMDVPTEGEYLLDGMPTHTLTKTNLARLRNEKVGFVFQNFHLLHEYTALENVEMPLSYRDLSRREARLRSLDALQQVGLEDQVHKPPNQLSGGQKQRVAIARALVGEPSILLADEPTGALDQRTGESILSLFQELHHQGRTIVLVTHDPHVASLCQKVYVMQDGRLGER